MRNILFLTATLFASLAGAVQATVLSNFNDGDLTGTFSNTWSGALIQNGTYATIGSPATDFGDYRSVNFTAISIASEGQISVTAKLDSGNTATGFTVNLISGSGSAYASAYFDATLFNSSGFTTASVSWVDGGSFNASSLRAWQIAGGSPSSSTTFRMSFDNLATTASAVPEPAAYAVLLGVASLGFVASRRRRAA